MLLTALAHFVNKAGACTPALGSPSRGGHVSPRSWASLPPRPAVRAAGCCGDLHHENNSHKPTKQKLKKPLPDSDGSSAWRC